MLQNEALDAKKILERMKQAVGAKTDEQLARGLGTRRSTITNWRSRRSIPFEKVVLFCRKYSVSPTWLIFGVGPRDLRDLRKVTEERLKLLELMEDLDEADIQQVMIYVGDKVRIRDLEKELRELRKYLSRAHNMSAVVAH